MKFSKNINRLFATGLFFSCFFLLSFSIIAQEEKPTEPEQTEVKKPKVKPVKVFESVWIGDNQTVTVPIKKTLELDIMHRFGTVKRGYRDFWGFFAPSNIRLGVSYSPINRLNLGIGITKSNMIWDGSAKYAIISQTKGVYPVSVTYYGNISYDTREDEDGSLFKWSEDRVMFFNQLIIARKLTKNLSVQVAPSVSHQNSVNGYYYLLDSTGKKGIGKEMKNDHFAIAFAARYKLTNVTSVFVNYDQPITKHVTNNPNPNLMLGVEFNTSSHSFQLFAGNYYYLSPQRNNLYNHNNYEDGEFLIGFNITRLWNY